MQRLPLGEDEGRKSMGRRGTDFLYKDIEHVHREYMLLLTTAEMCHTLAASDDILLSLGPWGRLLWRYLAANSLHETPMQLPLLPLWCLLPFYGHLGSIVFLFIPGSLGYLFPLSKYCNPLIS